MTHAEPTSFLDPARVSGQPGAARSDFDPARTVLLVIDPVNDFLSEGGAAWELTKHTVEMNHVVKNMRRAIDAARAAGIPVIYGPMAYTEEDYGHDGWQHRSGINRVMFEKKMFLAGSWGADFHPDLQPADGEVVLLPHKGTDVFMTDLPEHLERLGTGHIVIIGMTANLCCESTGRHAVEAGFDVTYLSDAIGAESVVAYEASVRVNYPLVGNAVMTVDQFEAALGAGTDSRSGPQAGDTVRGSDHGKIGTVDRVLQADDGHAACLVVSKGLVFPHDIYIPLEAVVRRSADEVFVNVPQLVAGKMPWNERPSHAVREEMHGPAADAVDRLYGSRAPSATPERRAF